METTAKVKVEEFCERLNALYRNIKDWMDGTVEFNDSKHELFASEVGDYCVPGLVLVSSSSNEPIAKVIPIGLDIIGAEGQIHIDGRFDSRTATYFIDGGPTISVETSVNGTVKEPPHATSLFPNVNGPDWYVITDPRTGETRHLDKKMFEEILAKVSDYGV